MIELINVKQIEDKKFDISIFNDGKKENYVIEANETEMDGLDEPFWVINSENPEFYDVWGQSVEFRKSVAKSIRLLKEKKVREPQTV